MSCSSESNAIKKGTNKDGKRIGNSEGVVNVHEITNQITNALLKRLTEFAKRNDIQALIKRIDDLDSVALADFNALIKNVDELEYVSRGSFNSFHKLIEAKYATREDFLDPINKAANKLTCHENCQHTKTVNNLSEKVECIYGEPIVLEVPQDEIITLNASPIKIFGKPGAGKFFDFDYTSQLFYDYDATPFADLAGNTLKLYYENGDLIWSKPADEIFNGTADRLHIVRPSNDLAGINEAVYLKMDPGEISGGDGAVIKLRLRYRVADVVT
jgi:hypothetical protein